MIFYVPFFALCTFFSFLNTSIRYFFSSSTAKKCRRLFSFQFHFDKNLVLRLGRLIGAYHMNFFSQYSFSNLIHTINYSCKHWDCQCGSKDVHCVIHLKFSILSFKGTNETVDEPIKSKCLLLCCCCCLKMVCSEGLWWCLRMWVMYLFFLLYFRFFSFLLYWTLVSLTSDQ